MQAPPGPARAVEQRMSSDSNLPQRNRSAFSRLPAQYAWEFLRRHPAYLEHWRSANRYFEVVNGGLPAIASAEVASLEQSVSILSALGISGPCYPDPATSGGSLGLDKVEDEHAARPMTLREVARAIVCAPKRTRKLIGDLLASEAGPAALETLADPYLDRELVGLVRFNQHVSSRAIIASLEKIIRVQKRQCGIQERRQRDSCLEDYLRAWDLREGWSEGRYDGAKERRLQDIARELQEESLQTVRARYESAFHHITGQPYDPTLWAAVFLPLKAGLSKRAPWRREKEAATNSIPAPVTADLSRESAPDQRAWQELLTEIRDLLARGKSDTEIAATIELPCSPEDAKLAVGILRQRGLDGL